MKTLVYIDHFKGEVQPARVTGIDNGAPRRAVRVDVRGANQKPCYLFNRFLCGRKADACEAPARQMIEAFERKGQMGTALVVGHGMDFVHDDGLDGPQHFSALRRGKKDVQGFRSGYQNMRRTNQHGAALVRERIPGAHRNPNLRHQDPALPCELQNFA